MSKKHLIALADLLIDLKPDVARCALGQDYGLGALREWESIREALADLCQKHNARFDRVSWMAYVAGECGPNRKRSGQARGTK